MNPNEAYVRGALVKMAEHNVDPGAFVRAAIQTQDPLALKVASAIVGLEKTAAGRTSALLGGARGLLDKGTQLVSEGVAIPAYRLSELALENPGLTTGLVGAGGLGLGAAGLAGAKGVYDYGMAPADTMENKLRALANRIPGLDLEQQSRLGYGLEQAGDYLSGLGQPGSGS